MLGEIIGSLISGGLGYLGKSKDQDTQMQIAQQNIALQKEFAQHGIQWKVEDAKAAGLHPLAALGAQTSSFSPVSVGSQDWGSLGQDIGRAVKAAADAGTREKYDEAEARKLALEKGALENDVLRQELVSKRMRSSALAGQIGPPMSVDPTSGLGWNRLLSHLDRSPRDRAGPEEQAVGEKAMEIPNFAGRTSKWGNIWGIYPYEKNPEVESAESLENEYGEGWLGSMMAGGNLPAHLWYDYKKHGWPSTRMKSWKWGPFEYRRR